MMVNMGVTRCVARDSFPLNRTVNARIERRARAGHIMPRTYVSGARNAVCATTHLRAFEFRSPRYCNARNALADESAFVFRGARAELRGCAFAANEARGSGNDVASEPQTKNAASGPRFSP